MNKLKISRHLLFFAAVSCLLASYLFYYIPKKNQQHIDSEAVEISADEQLEYLHREMMHIKEIFLKNFDQLEAREDNEKYFQVFNFCSDFDFPILIYKNNRLKYWSVHTPALPLFQYPQKFFDKNIAIEVGNGWYLKKIIKLGSHTLVGLIPVKHRFFYQNQYLQNKFTPAFRIPDSWLISGTPTLIGKEIRSRKTGKYLFSVIPPAEQTQKENPPGLLSLLLFLIGFALLLLYINCLNKKIEDHEFSYFYIGIGSLLLLILFFISIYFDLPQFLFKHASLIEETNAEEKSLLFPVHFMRISFIVLFFAVNIFRMIPFKHIFTQKIVHKRHFCVILQMSLFLLMFLFFDSLVKTIHVELSQFNDKSSIATFRNNIYLLGIYIEVGIFIASFFLLSDRLLRILLESFPKIQTFLFYLAFLATLIILALFDIGEFALFELSLFAFIHLFIFYIYFRKHRYNLYTISLITLGISLWVAFLFESDDERFEKRLMRTHIEKLNTERDRMAEHFLKEISPKLEADQKLAEMLMEESSSQYVDIREYLQKKYFYGFWDKYELSLLLCFDTPVGKNENHYDNCQRYYQKVYRNHGIKIGNTVFWNIGKDNRGICYTGNVKAKKNNSDKVSLYISLTERLSSSYLGYPDLLVEESQMPVKDPSYFSHAKYSGGILAAKSGTFGYRLNDASFRKKNGFKKEYFLEQDGYRHLIMRKNDRTLVVSVPERSFQTRATQIAYIFLLYFFMIALSRLLSSVEFFRKNFFTSFKRRIRLSMSFMLLFAFSLFAVSTIKYSMTQNDRSNDDRMREKIISLQGYFKERGKEWQMEGVERIDSVEMTEELRELSQTYFSDINLYDVTGTLVASSRPEIFSKKLLSTQMNSIAYEQVYVQRRSEFIHQESIGNLTYSSIYIPLQNIEKVIVGFINMPFFMRDNSWQKNISDIFVTTANIYVLLFLIVLFLTFGLSSGITYPLSILQSEFKSLQIGKKQEKIEYHRKDEIGELVEAYNLMVDKLESEAGKLAETERENAWREMAKQIAHEIKNPLTPMKLSIQLLQRSWNEDKDRFEARLNKVTYTLIEQINSLSNIAANFSAFAKMPRIKTEEVDIIKKLKSVKALFENTPHMHILLQFNGHRNLSVIADNQQISRVFINLLKNAIQAIPEDREGKIIISLYLPDKESVMVSVADNGIGIPEDKTDQLFEPTFTSKSSGSGIGLAIVKNIVQSVGGTISFSTKENIGTTFHITFKRCVRES